MLQIKVVQNLIFYKKVTGRIILSPLGVELGGLLQSQYIIIFQTWQSFKTLVPLQEEIDICAYCFFVGNLILNNFYLKNYTP